MKVRLNSYWTKWTIHLTIIRLSVILSLFSGLTSLFFPSFHSCPRSKKKSLFYHLSNWYHIVATTETSPHVNTRVKTNTSQWVERKTLLVVQVVFIQGGILEDKKIPTRAFFIINLFFLPLTISVLGILRIEHKNVT